MDGWLRGLNLSAKSRNGMLICVKVLFSFARLQNCLPAEQMTAAEQLKKVKVKSYENVAVFTPDVMRKILHAAPPHVIPILAIGAFSGIRMAELNRLDWSAIDLERGIIELRAGQAKTASRRPIPITQNLRAWIAPLLPKDFVRVRHHGWMSGAARKTRLRMRALVCGQLDEPKPVLPEPPIPRCPHCRMEMELIATIKPRGPPRHPHDEH